MAATAGAVFFIGGFEMVVIVNKDLSSELGFKGLFRRIIKYWKNSRMPETLPPNQ